MPALLDTNVVSELPKLTPNPNVLAYMRSQPLDQLFISTVTVIEIRYGILIAPDQHRKSSLHAWLQNDIRKAFQGRLLPITEDVLLRWRILLETGRKAGRTYS